MFPKKYKLSILIIFFLVSVFVFSKTANTQMMGDFPSVTPSTQDINEINERKNLLNDFKNNKITCSSLQNDDFEKIGEYVMNQQIGDSQKHVQMNLMMKQMMGQQGEENMHITLGRQATACDNQNAQNLSKGGFTNMMGWGYPTMMGNSGALNGYLGIITWAVVLIDLILLGVWLFKKIQK